MHIAVTGATGFLGRYMLRHLIQEGNRLRGWVRPTSDRSGLEDLEENLTWVTGDLCDADSCDRLVEGCDAVVHGALYHPAGGFQGGEGDLVEFVEANVVGTLRLIEAAKRARVQRFVFISTCAVHDKILDDRPLDENHPCTPASHYGAHKAAVEQFVQSFGLGAGYPICALRPTGVYGLAHPASKSKWFDLVSDVVQGVPVQVQRGGKEVHARDVARAASILLKAEPAQITGAIFNCYDRYVSHYDVALLAQEISGSSATIDGEPMHPKHQIENKKIRALGMEFGGEALLKQTVQDLVEAVNRQESLR